MCALWCPTLSTPLCPVCVLFGFVQCSRWWSADLVSTIYIIVTIHRNASHYWLVCIYHVASKSSTIIHLQYQYSMYIASTMWIRFFSVPILASHRRCPPHTALTGCSFDDVSWGPSTSFKCQRSQSTKKVVDAILLWGYAAPTYHLPIRASY